MIRSANASSRSSLGVGNTGKVLNLGNAPANTEELTMYISSEFKTIEESVNGLLQGQVIPLVSDVPKRLAEGLCRVFTSPVNDSSGKPIIKEPGVYIYLNNKWNKFSLIPVE